MMREHFDIVCEKFDMDSMNRSWLSAFHWIDVESLTTAVMSDSSGWKICERDTNYALFICLTEEKAREILDYIKETAILFT